MSKRVSIVSSYYNRFEEDSRLERSREGQLEYSTTMAYIHRFLTPGAKIIEIGAGTGRYSVALAKEGYDVTAVELVSHNFEVLKENGKCLQSLHPCQADATDLSDFADGAFDITLVFGPMYHLYEIKDVTKAIEEALRVTKHNGVIIFAFLSVYAILANNYFNGTLIEGINLNFSDDYSAKHFEEQLFTGYDIVEFENLFTHYPIRHLTTAAADGVLEMARRLPDFIMSDEEFEIYTQFHLATCEKRELLGSSSHLLYICRKT